MAQADETKVIKDNGNLKKEVGRKDATIAKLEKNLERANTKCDQHDARAKQLQKEKNALEVKLDKLRASVRNDDPMGKGAFEVRTKAEQLVRGKLKPAGTLVGFFTTIEGFSATMLADALHYGSARLVKADHHELYTELMGRADQTERLAVAEITIEEQRERIAALEAQLDEQRQAAEQRDTSGLADLNAKFDDLTARNAQLEAEHDKVKQELSSAKGLRTKAENKVEELQGQVAELEQQLEEATSPPETADDAAPEDDDPERA